ncbi:MAG TPA: DUF1573 domain-containing protein [Gemmataceae bacterium]|jgi:hypothetical protein|nr:DUF1573 domain-containing protein [Gemmataceae bacterium]
MNAIMLLSLLVGPAHAPQLACPEPVVDRGTVRGGPVLAQTFTLRNAGNSQVEILETRGSCGCLFPKLSARSLKPGESVTLSLEIGTLSQPEGPNVWSVYLRCRSVGSDTEQVVRVQVKANVQREVAIEPAALRLFGGPGLAHEITVIDRRAKPLEVVNVRTSSSRLLAEWRQPWQQTPEGWSRKLLVKLAGGPDGSFEEVVQLFCDDPDYREMRIPVTGSLHAKQRYIVSPEQVKLEVEPGKPAASFLLLIRDIDGKPVEIAKAECDDPALTCRFAEGAWPTATVRVQVKKNEAPAPQSKLQVQITQPAPQSLVIPVFVDMEHR